MGGGGGVIKRVHGKAEKKIHFCQESITRSVYLVLGW